MLSQDRVTVSELVLVIVTSMVQARVTTVEVPVIRDHRLLHS